MQNDRMDVLGGSPWRYTAKAPCQWGRLRRSGAYWALSTGGTFKARKIDGINDGIKRMDTTESGVNTRDGGCY